MKNKLVITNNLWYKIKYFFKKIFSKNNKKSLLYKDVNEKANKEIHQSNNLKEMFEKDRKNQELANKLLCGEISTIELNELEVDEMMRYFSNDIENIDNELLRIKQHIINMKKVLM